MARQTGSTDTHGRPAQPACTTDRHGDWHERLARQTRHYRLALRPTGAGQARRRQNNNLRTVRDLKEPDHAGVEHGQLRVAHLLVVHEDDPPHERREPDGRVLVRVVLSDNYRVRDRKKPGNFETKNITGDTQTKRIRMDEWMGGRGKYYGGGVGRFWLVCLSRWASGAAFVVSSGDRHVDPAVLVESSLNA